MRILLTIILFINLSISYSQSGTINGKDTLNFIDAEGRKQGKWIITNEQKNLPGYAANSKVEEGRFKDNKKIGIWTEYYGNGVMKSRITFVNGRPFGHAVIYHENGKVMEEGQWENNRWVGDYKLFYDNGEPQHEFKFNKSGKREGPQKYFHPNGELMIEGVWANGNEAGEVKEYYDNGDLKSVKSFNNGTIDPAATKTYEPKKPVASAKTEPVVPTAPPAGVTPKALVVDAAKEQTNLGVFNGEGQWKLYNKNKQISKDGIFSKGKLVDGKIYFYNSDGILTRIGVYKGGSYVGDAPIEDQ